MEEERTQLHRVLRGREGRKTSTRECSQQVGVVKGGGSRCHEAKYCGIQLYDSMCCVCVCVCVFVCVCVCNVW